MLSVLLAVICIVYAASWLLYIILEAQMSQATDRLNASIAALSSKVDALIVSKGNEAVITAAADAVDAVSAKVDAAVSNPT